MKDVFYGLLIAWVIYRLFFSSSNARTMQGPSQTQQNEPPKKPGSVSVDYVPPKNKSVKDDEGEYVDYEEVK